jgi:hypothetical protein
MPVNDQEPRYRLAVEDADGNIVDRIGSLFAEGDGTVVLQEGSGSNNEARLESDGTLATPAVNTESIATELEDGSDVSSSRSFDTVYQNSNTYDILVQIRIDGDPMNAFLAVGSSSSLGGGERVDGIGLDIGSSSTYLLTGRVPPGYYYEAVTFGSESITRWDERGLTD